ncbi:hypothetical protein NPIL_690981 [Nephila pilipes]|uniref:Uncharacterized protein n=1 Tax=Nephila pilipes TaxID=299642 RepID=A0A8X6TWB2_NEPPI|nr:hypothetical protein NPIL_690981 [Nephila pilipes]
MNWRRLVIQTPKPLFAVINHARDIRPLLATAFGRCCCYEPTETDDAGDVFYNTQKMRQIEQKEKREDEKNIFFFNKELSTETMQLFFSLLFSFEWKLPKFHAMDDHQEKDNLFRWDLKKLF